MILTVINLSAQVAAADFRVAIAAIGRQVAEDFRPEWGVEASVRGAALRLAPGRDAAIQGRHDALIYVGDSSQDPTAGVGGAHGYHSRTYGNVPYGFVYLDVCRRYGEPWTRTLSHEVLELLADPTAVLTVAGPAPRGGAGSVHYDLEVCDPTQGDSYSIDGVDVANFVGRAYFGLPGGSGRTNHLRLRLAPFGVRPGGYFQYEDGRGTHQVHGPQVTAQQLAAKRLLGSGRRNERRRLRVAAAKRRRRTGAAPVRHR
ncbi:MAG: hypothetical protein JSR54_05260 [Proteobacteria bacterium]|nr:hypothetical protein [Pseudomonadota bacterium]